MSHAEIGHLQADERVGRVLALLHELVDDAFAVGNKLLRARKIAIVSGKPSVICFETIQHAARCPLGLGQLLIECLEFRCDRHLEFGPLLALEAARPLIDLQPHPLAGAGLGNIERATGHVVARRRSRIRRRGL